MNRLNRGVVAALFLVPLASYGGDSRRPAPRDLHAAEINARAQRGIEATMRDTMRSIDDSVLRRSASSAVLPLIHQQRHTEETLAGIRHEMRWERIAADWQRYEESRGRALGPHTRRVLEQSDVEMWVRARQEAVSLEAVERDLEARPEPVGLDSFVP